MKVFKSTAIFSIIILTTIQCSQTKIAYLSPTAQLKQDIQELFDDPNFYMANWGVYIESLKTGEIIYKRNPNKLFMPASNMKLFTTSTALIRLGPEYTYTTMLLSRGEVTVDGTLQGDLIIKGSGDPTMSGRFNDGNVIKIFQNWADSVKSLGIKHINGNIIGDDNYFDDNYYGSGWEYDDLSFSYAAQVSGLSFNENSIQISVIPGAKTGIPAQIAVNPSTEYVSIINKTFTVNPTRIQRIRSTRRLGTNNILVDGTISIDRIPQNNAVSVENPTLFAVTVFKEVLEESGISVSGAAQDIDDINADNLFEDSLTTLAVYTSPPLSEIVKVTNKNSNNFYAEQLLKTLGYEFLELGSFENGAQVVKDFLAGIGINTTQFFMYDGSGLSRHNMVMPVQVAELLKYMRHYQYFRYFYDSLPVAGVDGTISGRMKNTAAENSVHAKTGTIRFVRALSGYVRSKDDEEFIVSLLVNNFTSPSSTSGALQDRLFVLLANFYRGK